MQRIFVSATLRGLGSYRRLAGESLRERGYQVDDQPIANLTYLETGPRVAERIGACDAVVCLIGLAYGAEPSWRPADQARRSFRQWEHLIARQLDKPVYLLLAHERTPFDPDNRQPETRTCLQLQLTYRAQVARDRDWRSFASKDELRARLGELRFPWEPPLPEQQPCRRRPAGIGELVAGCEPLLASIRLRLLDPADPVDKTTAFDASRLWPEHNTALLCIWAPSPAGIRAALTQLVGVLRVPLGGQPVHGQLAEAVRWLGAHPGWLLLVDNVVSDELARHLEDLLAEFRPGHVLITSRTLSRSADGIRPGWDVLAPADAADWLRECAPNHRGGPDDPAQAAAIARELDGLAPALEQAGACINKLRLSFGEYLAQWQARRHEVLHRHDKRPMKYPVSMVVTWETTRAHLTEAQRRLLNVLGWLAPQPVPLCLLDAKPLVKAAGDSHGALAGLVEWGLARLDAAGAAVVVDRHVQEMARRRGARSQRRVGLRTALAAVAAMAGEDPGDVRTWPVWTPLAPHADIVVRRARAARFAKVTAWLLNQLGLYWQARGWLRDAERAFRRALAIAEASYGPDHPAIAFCLTHLAGLLHRANRLAEAEPLLRRVLAIDEAAHEPNHPTVVADLINVGWLFLATNRAAEAESLMRRALASVEVARPPDQAGVATCLGNLGRLLLAVHRGAEAEPLLRRALAIVEASHSPDDPAVAACLTQLADLLRTANRLPEAEPLYRRALPILERGYGADHPDVATCLTHQAELLTRTNRPAGAEPLLRRALAIWERTFGAGHSSVAIGLNNLALLLQDTNRLAEAEPLLRRALMITRASFGRNHPDVAIQLNSLGSMLSRANRLAEAEPLFRRALTIAEASRGPNHPDVAVSLDNLANVLQRANRLAEAEPLYRRALAIFEVSYGPEHPDVALALANLALLLKATNRLAQAEALFQRAFEVLLTFFRTTGHEHPKLRAIIASYSSLLQAMGQTPDQMHARLGEIVRSFGPSAR